MNTSRLSFASLARVSGAVLALNVAVFAYFGCSGSEEKPAPLETQGQFSVVASPARVQANGATTDLTVIARLEGGGSGTGTVTLKVPQGDLGTTGTTASLELASGQATVKYACNAATNPACVGTQKVTAEWNGKTSEANVTFYVETAGEAGVADGGDAGVKTDGGDAATDARTDSATTDSGPDTGTTDSGSNDAAVDAPPNAPILTLTPSKSRFFVNVADFVDVTASLRTSNDAGVVANSTMTVTATGALLLPDTSGTGTPAASVTVTTDSNGRAVARVVDNGSSGNATVTVTHDASGVSKQVTLVAAAVQQLQYVSTKCQGQACTVMGVKGSGFNEQAQVAFRALDAGGQPVANARVEFRALNPPQGTMIATPFAFTDALGVATTNVTSGLIIGSFVVEATLSTLSAQSTTIGVRGAKAANKSFSLRCSPVNLAAYATPTPPLPLTAGCDVRLIDRFNNPVGTGTSVNFKTEAGNVPNSISTTAYTPMGNNANEGLGTINFSTVGSMPVDVAPLDADPAQIPSPRGAEPRAGTNPVYNPRDNLVSVIAYLPGEEFFQDDNANGTHDPAEQFIDQGEPFVDSNDNGVWDTGEIFIDTPQTLFDSNCNPVTADGGVAVTTAPNGVWDGPNGCWDVNSTIWAETRVLYTDRPTGSPFSYVANPDTGDPTTNLGKIAVGSSRLYPVHFRDRFFNYPEGNATYSVSQTGTRGTLSYTGSQLDSYGFGIERLLMEAGTGQLCGSTTTRCEWRYHFNGWIRDPSYQPLRVTGPTTASTIQTDAGPAINYQATTIAPAITVRSVKFEMFIQAEWP
ncbi:MAG: hypothetical protein U0169_13730 [Polyangiaceae bacterium]